MKRIALMMALIALAPLALAQENFITLEQNGYLLFCRLNPVLKLTPESMVGVTLDTIISDIPVYSLPDFPDGRITFLIESVNPDNRTDMVFISTNAGKIKGVQDHCVILDNGQARFDLVLPDESVSVFINVTSLDDPGLTGSYLFMVNSDPTED